MSKVSSWVSYCQSQWPLSAIFSQSASRLPSSKLSGMQLLPLDHMEVRLRRVEPATQTAYFLVTHDRLTGDGQVIGGRYLALREQDAWVGIDIARGPEDLAWYIQLGSSW